jgi:hypothetical protein
MYNHDVIKELRASNAQLRLILAALVEHTGTSQEQLNDIASKYLMQKASEAKRN